MSYEAAVEINFLISTQTAEDGMPDRYLVTHTITKDVKNEDLRDFLQESIEECFQILDNGNHMLFYVGIHTR